MNRDAGDEVNADPSGLLTLPLSVYAEERNGRKRRLGRRVAIAALAAIVMVIALVEFIHVEADREPAKRPVWQPGVFEIPVHYAAVRDDAKCTSPQWDDDGSYGYYAVNVDNGRCRRLTDLGLDLGNTVVLGKVGQPQ
jgi:hypothetical protein